MGVLDIGFILLPEIEWRE